MLTIITSLQILMNARKKRTIVTKTRHVKTKKDPINASVSMVILGTDTIAQVFHIIFCCFCFKAERGGRERHLAVIWLKFDGTEIENDDIQFSTLFFYKKVEVFT